MVVRTADVDGTMAAVRKAIAPLAVGIKTPPEDPWRELCEAFPQFNWDLKAEITAKEHMELVKLCRSHIAGGPVRVRANTNTFAAYVATMLRPVVNVPAAEGEKRSHFELFSSNATWHIKHRDDLAALTAYYLRRLVSKPCTFWWEKVELQDPPPPLNAATFCSSLTDTILGMLASKSPMAPLNGERCRGKLLFKESMVYDFRVGGTPRKATPQDRMSFRMGCKYELWTPPAEFDVQQFFDAINDYCKFCSDDPEQVVEVPQLIIEGFEYLEKAGCELLKVMRPFAGSVKCMLWFLRTIARAAMAEPRICEFAYIFGPGSSGKDALLLLLLAFFGEEPDSYATTLNGSFIVDQGGRGAINKEQATPFLAATAGKHFIWVSEVFPRSQKRCRGCRGVTFPEKHDHYALQRL